MIPKRLLVTHMSEHTLEHKLKFCIQRMKELHPEWEFQFFSDGDCRHFLECECPEYLEVYDWYPRAVMRADLFRLLVVSRLGGFYLDSDMLLEKPLDPLTGHAAVFVVEQHLDAKVFRQRYPRRFWDIEPRKTLGNYAFGAEAGHPFLTAILDELIVRTANFDAEDCGDLDILYATGPEAVTAVYHQERDRWANVEILDGPGQTMGDYGCHLIHSGWREKP